MRKVHHEAHRREHGRQCVETDDVVTALKQNPRLTGSILLDQGSGNG
ncbi:hypothetical protein [Streptomyces zaomyceticus]